MFDKVNARLLLTLIGANDFVFARLVQHRVDLPALLDRHWNKSGYASGEEEAHYYAKGYRALENYCAARFDSREETIGTEVFMSYIVSAGGAQFRLSCKADRIAVLPDGALEIIDYKTSAGGKVPAPEFLQNDLPTFLYYALARLSYPEYKNVRISFLNVLTLAKSAVGYDTQQVTTNKQALIGCLKTVAVETYAPRSSEACSWCAFRDTCPAANKVADFSLIT